MADPLAEESKKYCVGGLVPYNKTKAQYYLVEVIGKKERIPLRFGLKDGTEEVERCLRARYGASCTREFLTLLDNQLAPSEDDNEIWGPWRSEHAIMTALKVAEILTSSKTLSFADHISRKIYQSCQSSRLKSVSWNGTVAAAPPLQHLVPRVSEEDRISFHPKMTMNRE